MNDGLRSGVYIPKLDPYSRTDTIASNVLTVKGSNAIVDWIKIELRDKNSSTTILQTRNVLLQCNGSIVDTDGVSPVFFSGMSADNQQFSLKVNKE